MTDLDNYYDRTNDEVAKGYERHLFRAGNVLQSAELNEIQGAARNRLKLLGDAIFKDGDVIRDARVVVDSATGDVIAESGAVYLDGAVRGVPPATFSIDVTGTVVIGIYLDATTITELEDPSLSEPAVETQAYGESGAARLRIETRWGTQLDDAENFYPIYYVDDGQLRAKEAPPAMDAVTQAIARYDVDSTGSNYVVEGMRVRRMDDEGSNQVYSIDEGRARVNGFGLTLANSRRLTYPTAPEVKLINSEPVNSSSAVLQHVTLARPPAREIIQVNITKETTANITHASFSGGADPLPNPSVVQLVSITQGGTTYEYGTDYVLTGQTVDWSPNGNEPAPGSTYEAVFRHITAVTPQNATKRGFDVSGAVVGTLILTTYNTMLPRIDRLCIDESGKFVWVQGVSTDYNPVRPQMPSTLISLAQIAQNWDETSTVVNDGVRTVSMREIEGLGTQIRTLTDLMAQQLLISDIDSRESGVKKGLFVDPFTSDVHRDAGIAQTAAIVSGALMLPITPDVRRPTADITSPQVCAYDIEFVAAQTERTGSMKINPYMAFEVPAALSFLDPSVDRWTETKTNWLSDQTKRFVTWSSFGYLLRTTVTKREDLISSQSSKLQYLRQIEVKFTLSGFGPGEVLSSVEFDGIPVLTTAI